MNENTDARSAGLASLEKGVADAIVEQLQRDHGLLNEVVQGDDRQRDEYWDRIRKAMTGLCQQGKAFNDDLRRHYLALIDAECAVVHMIATGEILPEDYGPALTRSLTDTMKAANGAAVQAPEMDTVTPEPDSQGMRNNSLITSVTVPEGLEELAESYFFGCSRLKSVSLPATLGVIGDYAFFGCSRLGEIALPRDLEHIGAYAFSRCSSLRTVRIPGGVKHIGVAAFRNCGALERLELSRDGCLRELGSHAFQNCSRLRELALPEGLRELPTSLFYGCEALEALEIPHSVERLGAEVFQGCWGMKRLSFHNGDTLLMPDALAGLESTELTLSGRVFPWARITEPIRLRELIA